jgi:hypothetical protein
MLDGELITPACYVLLYKALDLDGFFGTLGIFTKGRTYIEGL